jgi:hypothetical protein
MASGGTIMEAGIAHARCAVTGHPLAGCGASGGKLAASRYVDDKAHHMPQKPAACPNSR